jgi:hypothetical protein
VFAGLLAPLAPGTAWARPQAPDTRAGQVEAGRRGRPAGQRPAAGAALPSPEGRTVAEVEQLFDRYMLGQARQFLRLDAQQMRAFAPRLQQLQQTRRRAARERQRLLRELNELTRPGAATDDAALTAKLAEIEERTAVLEQQVRDAVGQLQEGLTLAQRARLPLFEQRMDRQKLQLLARARGQ